MLENYITKFGSKFWNAPVYTVVVDENQAVKWVLNKNPTC